MGEGNGSMIASDDMNDRQSAAEIETGGLIREDEIVAENGEGTSVELIQKSAMENEGSVEDCQTANDIEPVETQSKPVRCGVLKTLCPPRGVTEKFMVRGLIVLVVFATFWSIVGEDMLPGGNLFSLFVLLLGALIAGYLVRVIPKANLPPLLGMLLAGFLLRNIPAINIAKNIDKNWSSSLRNMALVVILLRSGLGLDIEALRKLKCTVIRLAFLPCVMEALTVAVAAHLLLGMPWLWGLQLGFILGAVSPAVVVPSMLSLQLSGYGTAEGIPTLVMAASSCDDVLAISMFGVFLGVAFSKGNLAFNILRGPIELVMGIVIGGLFGILLWYLPNKYNALVARYRCVLLLGLGLLSVFGSSRAEFSGAGALGVLTLAAVAGIGWGEMGKVPVANALAVAWDFFQPLLFGLIGAEVSVEFLSGQLIGRGLATLFIGLVFRLTTTLLAVFGNSLTMKERLFIAIAWLPKATVQAAIGSLPLLVARERGYSGQYQERLGREIVTIAVLVILTTAPIGAIGIALAGPKCLRRHRKSPEGDVGCPEVEEHLMVDVKS